MGRFSSQIIIFLYSGAYLNCILENIFPLIDVMYLLYNIESNIHKYKDESEELLHIILLRDNIVSKDVCFCASKHNIYLSFRYEHTDMYIHTSARLPPAIVCNSLSQDFDK